MDKIFSNISNKFNITAVTLAAVCATAPLVSQNALAAKQRNSYTDPACSSADAVCGAIIYGNAGGYTVDSVHVQAKGTQPSGVQVHPQCAGVDTAFKDSLNVGQYDLFILPANCAYHLKIKIVAGNKKDRNLFLTPGCQIETKTDGTTTINEWHMNVKWTDKAKQQGMSGTVQDKDGHKCGKLGKI